MGDLHGGAIVAAAHFFEKLMVRVSNWGLIGVISPTVESDLSLFIYFLFAYLPGIFN